MDRKLLGLLLITCLLLTAGCWDRREINETVVAVAMGVDTFQNDKILFTVQLPTTESGEQEQKSAFVTVSAVDDTFTTANRKIMLKNPRSILWQHSAITVLGEDLVKKGLSGLVDEFARNRNIRETEDIFIARNTTAAEVLSVPTPVEKIPAKALDSMIRVQDTAAGIYTQASFKEFISRTAAPGIEPAVPGIAVVERDDGNKYLELSGTAVFKGGKLVGWLNEEESRGYRWLSPKTIMGGTITIRCPIGGEPVLVENIRAQSQIIPEVRNGEVIMHIKVREECYFYEQRCLHQLVSPEMLPVLNRHIEQVINNQILNSVHRAQVLNSDIFGFGAALKKKYPGQWAALGPHWNEIFPTVKLDIKVKAIIRRTGLRSQTATLKY